MPHDMQWCAERAYTWEPDSLGFESGLEFQHGGQGETHCGAASASALRILAKLAQVKAKSERPLRASRKDPYEAIIIPFPRRSGVFEDRTSRGKPTEIEVCEPQKMPVKLGLIRGPDNIFRDDFGLSPEVAF